MSRSKIFIGIVLMGLIFFSGCIIQERVETTPSATESPAVTQPPTTVSTNVAGSISKVGDTVSVNYIGMLEDGSVFDTSDKSIALDPSVPKIGGFHVKDDYSPLTFKIGAGQVIEGFDAAVVGMRVGDVKQVSIPPEKGYGSLTDEMITYSLRSFSMPRLEEITNAEFHAKLGIDPVKGEMIHLTDLYWGDTMRRWDNATVYDIDWKGAMVTLYHEPLQGSIIETPIGIIQVSVDDDTITQTLTPEIGKTIYTKSGDFVTVLGYDDEQIEYAKSPKLEGKTLVFKIKLEEIL